MKVLSFINILLLFNTKSSTQKSNTKASFTICEYNIDCELPQICCKGFFVNYCCVPDGLTLSPIPINKKKNYKL
jgi:hypothetical protein